MRVEDEVERKYDVDEDCLLPDLTEAVGVAAVTEPVDLTQVATYYDTAELRLLTAGVTLRRRVGGVDDGWHLKLPPSGDRRTELRLPPGAAEEAVPDALVDRVCGLVRDTAVVPVGVLTTRRRMVDLLGSDGEVLATVCDDLVRSETVSPSPTVDDWREWEVELVDGPATLLAAVEPLLLDAGARASTVRSKAARVLAELLPARRPRHGTELDSRSSTGDVLAAYLGEHVRRLQEQDLAHRGGDEDAIHQMRVASRRLRSALAAYAPILDPAAAAPVHDELRWLGQELAGARDAQVLEARVLDLLRSQSADTLMSRTEPRVSRALGRRSQERHAEANGVLGGARYFRLLDRLEELVADLPFTEAADSPAATLLPQLLRSQVRRVRRRHRRAADTSDPVEHEAAVHDVRKAAKRLRYAAESARPVVGKRAKQLAHRARRVQQVLGEHQDTAVTRHALLDLATNAQLGGPVAFSLGRLHAQEEQLAAALIQSYPAAYARLPTRHTCRWLRG